MATITVYLKDNGEKKRRRSRRNLFALLAALVLAIVAWAQRNPPPPPAPQAPAAATPQVVEKIVYVDRPVIQYSNPIGPVAAPPAPTPALKPAPRDTRPTPAPKPAPRPTPPAVRPSAAVPAPEPEPPQTATQAPPPPRVRRRLLVEPRSIFFENGGAERITITNPNPTPVTVFEIRLGMEPGQSTAGFKLSGEQRCYKTLAPGERCSFKVSAARGLRAGIGILIRHDG